jgi:hypothetical protein
MLSDFAIQGVEHINRSARAAFGEEATASKQEQT